MSAFLPKMSAAEFNAKFPVGSEFDYCSVRGGAEVSPPLATKTRSEAWTLGHGAVVVACDGKTGGLDITHLKPVEIKAPAEPMLRVSDVKSALNAMF